MAIGEVHSILETQIQRLSSRELDLLRWLAVGREAVGVARLAAETGLLFDRGTMLSVVEGLRRRSLLDRSEGRPGNPSTFSLQSVVLEFVSDQLIDELAQEMVRGELRLLCRLPVVKATAREHVRRSQERLLGSSLLARLATIRGSVQAAERLLLDLLDQFRSLPSEAHGYGPGNVVNLLRLQRGDLKGVDMSGLAIRQAYVQDVEAHGASLAGALPGDRDGERRGLLVAGV
jgi:hypothetical protein